MTAITDAPFRSFWLAGFECADHLNAHGDRVNLAADTGHLRQLADDYALLKDIDIYTAREGIRWSFVEKTPGVYDWTTVEKMIETGRQQGVQQIWDICHFGFPTDLSPLHPHFTRRFVAVCEAFVRFYRSVQPTGLLWVTPINEVSFISWLGGEEARTTPYCTGMGWEIKYRLLAAYIEGIKAMRALDSGLRVLTTEPLVNIVPPAAPTPEEVALAAEAHEHQYQAVDMLCGRICPELGGSPDLVDVLGFNFYYNNQWTLGFESFLPWVNTGNDWRWRPLRDLLAEAHRRYDLPVALTETSHPREHRPDWIRFIGEECAAAIQAGVPLEGVCLYPIIDRPDWDHLHLWHQSGLWDRIETEGHIQDRVRYEPAAQALREAQQMITEAQENRTGPSGEILAGTLLQPQSAL